MLSALKEGQASRPGENSLDLFPFESLYEVLDSMQGLRQLIEGVSLDEIVEADEKAKRLIQRVSSLQTGLANLDATKQFLARVKETIITEFRENNLEAQTKSPDFDALKNLFAKLWGTTLTELAETKIKSQTALSDLDATKQFLVQVKEAISTESADSHIEPKKEIPTRHSQGQGTKAPNNLIPFPGPSKIAKEEAKSLSAESVPSTSQLRDKSTDPKTVLEKALALAENQLSIENQTPKTHLDVHPGEKDRTSTGEQSDFTLGEKQVREQKFELGFSMDSASGDKRESGFANDIHPETPSTSVESSTAPTSSKREGEPAKSEISFDQDLLNNLIKEYGEFTIYTKLSADIKSADIKQETTFIPNHVETRPQPSQSATPKTELHYDHSVQTRQKKEVDLDKKLKRLVTAYGEVDKYSTNSRYHIKKSVLAISALIIISIVAAFFFTFRDSTPPPAQTAVPSIPSVVPSNTVDSLTTDTPSVTTVQTTKRKVKSTNVTPAKESSVKEPSAAKEE